MIKKHFTEVPSTPITREGFKGMNARFALIAEDGCPNYAMRIMEFEPGGHTSLHAHEEEHEFYFLDGEPAYADCKGNETLLKPGDMIYVPSNEPHQLKCRGPWKSPADGRPESDVRSPEFGQGGTRYGGAEIAAIRNS